MVVAAQRRKLVILSREDLITKDHVGLVIEWVFSEKEERISDLKQETANAGSERILTA